MQPDEATIMATSAKPSAETLAITERLIAFPTVSRESNLDLIHWVEQRLRGQGAQCRLTYDEDRRKANLFATIGPAVDGGIILSGHSDVVPVDGQRWTTDPFTAQIRDDRLFGRGSADMKGFIAAALALVPRWLAANKAQPLHIALSYDEEVGCLGVRRMLEDVTATGLHPRGCIVGEPTGMKLVAGHKGCAIHNCTVTGRAAHSSLAPQGVNAIEYAARLIVRLREMADRLVTEERHHDGFDIAHSTICTVMIGGGIATNIVPERCEFHFDIRHLPWTSAEAIVVELQAYADETLLPQMRAVAPESAISFRQVADVPAFDIAPDASLVAYADALLASRGTPSYVGFGTEAGLFQKAGIPSVICGPGHIAQAHKADEYVALDQLAACEAFLNAMLDRDLAVI